MAQKDEEEPQIHHLVLSGGGIRGILTIYGILRRAYMDNMWSHDHLKSIYGTSAGAFVAFIIALKIKEWNILDDFFILRPWHKIIHWKMVLNIASIISRGGILDRDVFIRALEPIFEYKDLCISTTTLAQLFAATQIELHLYCVEITNFVFVDMSHITHPDTLVIDAIYRSCCIPFIFVPQRDTIRGHIFADGSIMQHYALQQCISQQKCETEFDRDRILGIKIIPHTAAPAAAAGPHTETDETKETSFDLFSYIGTLFARIFAHLNNGFSQSVHPPLKHEYAVFAKNAIGTAHFLTDHYAMFYSADARSEIILQPPGLQPRISQTPPSSAP